MLKYHSSYWAEHFRPDDFDLVSGQTQFKLDRLAAGSNSSQTVVVRPRKFGYFNFTAAEVLNRFNNLRC